MVSGPSRTQMGFLGSRNLEPGRPKLGFERYLLLGQVWWYTTIIPTLGSLKQEKLKFETSLDYIERPCLTPTPPQKDVYFYSVLFFL
jgi:hypothetical protein